MDYRPKFVVPEEMEFTDISSEAFRMYRFPKHEIVRIEEPLYLHVSAAGGHRIFDINGHSHYIPSGWIQLTWEAKEGQPNFVR